MYWRTGPVSWVVIEPSLLVDDRRDDVLEAHGLAEPRGHDEHEPQEDAEEDHGEEQAGQAAAEEARTVVDGAAVVDPRARAHGQRPHGERVDDGEAGAEEQPGDEDVEGPDEGELDAAHG